MRARGPTPYARIYGCKLSDLIFNKAGMAAGIKAVAGSPSELRDHKMESDT